MKSTFHKVRLAALVCGAVLAGLPALAAGAGSAAGPSARTGALSNSGGDINNTTAGNNAGSVDMSNPTPSKRPSERMSGKARVHAGAAEETTRQLNQQQAQLNEQSSAGSAAKATPPIQ